jgi:hypothetical protein
VWKRQSLFGPSCGSILRSALHRAFERWEATLSTPIPVKFNGGPALAARSLRERELPPPIDCKQETAMTGLDRRHVLEVLRA